MTQASVLAVIVTHHPNIPALTQLVAHLEQQVERLIIIDNATPGFCQNPPIHNPAKTNIICNIDNRGLATAYNQGIDLAYSRQASHVLLLDQDSLPAHNMVNELLTALHQHNHQEIRVAAAGPMYTDIKGQSTSPFVCLRGIYLQRIDCEPNQVVFVDHLISSGSLIDLRSIDLVGRFTDSLFIDYVDTEWCWRARRKGLMLIGVGSAHMQHNLGDSHFKAFGKNRVLHAPFRLYYQMRNQWWMILQPWVGWRWRLMNILRSTKIFLAITLFYPQRIKRIRYMTKGILDAYRSRMGKLKD
jgi:rhamnosyltransferase